MLCVREFIHMLSHVYLMSSFWENLWFLVWVLYFLCACGFVFYSLSLLFVFIFIFFFPFHSPPFCPPSFCCVPSLRKFIHDNVTKDCFFGSWFKFLLRELLEVPLAPGAEELPTILRGSGCTGWEQIPLLALEKAAPACLLSKRFCFLTCLLNIEGIVLPISK